MFHNARIKADLKNSNQYCFLRSSSSKNNQALLTRQIGHWARITAAVRVNEPACVLHLHIPIIDLIGRTPPPAPSPKIFYNCCSQFPLGIIVVSRKINPSTFFSTFLLHQLGNVDTTRKSALN